MIVQLVATWIPALLIALSGALKLSRSPRIVEAMTTLGVGRYLRLLGVMELMFAALFVVPVTFKPGLRARVMLFRGRDCHGAVA